MESIRWPDGIDVDRFLSDYWQRQPLFIPAAFAEFENPLPADELAGLACDIDANSRLIENPVADQWALRHGPFSTEDFKTLSHPRWSLLVTDVEKLLPDFRQYLLPFRFIPDWRIDDLMISYAPPGASVGAHTDAYDVFLLQAAGEREWQFQLNPLREPELVPDIDLKILRDFTADQTVRCYPGDLLYLPPHFAHHGIAISENCMTWSVGFRAPDQIAMAEDWMAERIAQCARPRRFGDPGMHRAENPGEISTDALIELKRLMDEITQGELRQFGDWFGQWVTAGEADPVDADTITVAVIDSNTHYERRAGTKMAYIRGEGELSAQLFVDGCTYNCSLPLAQTLCAEFEYSGAELERFSGDDAAVIRQLLAADAIVEKI